MKKLMGFKLAGFIVAVILLYSSFYYLFTGNKRIEQEQIQLTSAYESISKFNDLNLLYSQLSIFLRNYIQTNNSEHYSNYQQTKNRVKNITDSLNNYFHTTPHPRDIVESYKFIENAFATKNKSFDSILNIFQNSSSLAYNKDSLINYIVNHEKFDLIAQNVDRNSAYEYLLLKNIAGKRQETSGKGQLLYVLAGLFSLLFIVFVFSSYKRESDVKTLALKKADTYLQELNGKIEELNNAHQEIIELKSEEKFASTGRIARVFAHEVRNPLTNINLASDQLRELVGEDEDGKMMLGIIDRNSARVSAMLKNLLYATKFLELHIKKNDIHQIILNIIGVLKDTFTMHQTKLDYSLDAEDHIIDCDSEKIEIAISNLITNAVESYEGKPGNVSLKTWSNSTSFFIEIVDNGIGITEENINKIFEPFFTVKEKGNGLGLSHALNIIKNHKGKLTVDSEEGKGSTFLVQLPINKVGE